MFVQCLLLVLSIVSVMCLMFYISGLCCIYMYHPIYIHLCNVLFKCQYLCKALHFAFLFYVYLFCTRQKFNTVFLSCSCSQGDVVTHTAWLNRSSILYAGEDKWSVDGRVSLVTLNRDEFTIKIENIDLSDEGLYVCAVQTNSKPRTTSVHVIVQGELNFHQHVFPSLP